VSKVPKYAMVIELFQEVFIDYWLNLVDVIIKTKVGGDVEQFVT
jgi:hypothetical protein